VTDLDLRPGRRDRLAAGLSADLAALMPGSAVSLRGSLAAGTADEYSDIDLCWTVADESFTVAASAAADLTVRLPSVRVVRLDPDFARSDRRRLVFVRLAAVPLFWRVDLDVRASSVAADDSYDDGNEAARDLTGWSRPASAIENAIGAIKNGLRGRDGETNGLLSRGYARIGLVDPAEAGPAEAGPAGTGTAQAGTAEASPAGDDLARISLAERVTGLADACARLEPGLALMAAEVREVAAALLPRS
jgi:predicted nucleotidyltransferase